MKNVGQKIKQKGQSTIEFVFVIFAFIFFLSMSYNAVVSFAVYQYLSYANFMAARAYQASRDTRVEQMESARKVMNVYVPGIKIGNQNVNFGFSASRPLARIRQWNVPRADQMSLPQTLVFDVPFLTLPLGDSIRQQFGNLSLKNAVMLGREPAKEECREFFINILGTGNIGGTPHNSAGMEDNGC